MKRNKSLQPVDNNFNHVSKSFCSADHFGHSDLDNGNWRRAYCDPRVQFSGSSAASNSSAQTLNSELLDTGTRSISNHKSPCELDKPAASARNNLQRKQYTLDTLFDQKSRSRSPIVATLDPSRADISTLETGRNPFSISSNAARRSDDLTHQLHRIERCMSPTSFARRRSVYESPADRYLGDLHQMNEAGGSSSSMRKSDTGKVSLLSLSSILDSPLEAQCHSNAPLKLTGETDERKYLVANESKLAHSSQLSPTCSSADLPSISESSNGNESFNVVSNPYSRWKGERFTPDNNAVERRRHETQTGFEIAWLDFTYSIVPSVLEDPRWGKINSLFHKEPRTIIKGISGGLRSGQMVALMGPSGAGKTCLLESISGVRTVGLGGRLCLRGRRHAQIVIVPQYDDFLPQFSVEETIVYGSRMKNPPSTNHKQVADEVIEQFGLKGCRKNNINRCSGGQRKRVAIAQELVSRPNILILDEPTSGLDSSCCFQTMRVLREVLDKSVLTEQPMAIVSTIHQPSAKVFKMFDLVYLLGKTGLMAYSGTPEDVVSTIRDVAGLECPKYSNPADFIIELVAYDYGEEPVERLIEFEKEKARMFVRHFDQRADQSGGARRAPPKSNQRAPPPQAQTQQVSSAVAGEQLRDNFESVSQAPSSNLNENETFNYGSSQPKLVATNNSNRLQTSCSDSQLTLKPKFGDAKLVENRLLASKLIANNIDYANNITLPLRKATSGSNASHPFFWHVWVHLHRSFLQAVRDPILNSMRIMIHLGFASLLVLLYGEKSGQARGCPTILGLPAEITDPHNESMIDLADNVGYLFMCIMLITYVSLMSTVLTFPIDIKTVGKEYKNGWYGTVTYFIGKNVADLPFITLYPVIYCFITWHATNQAQDHLWRYASFTGLIIINAMNSQSFGLILGALFVNSVAAATFLGPVMTIPWYLFTGFTKRVHRLAEPFKTTSKFLFTRYVFEGLLDTVYGHQRCNCSAFLHEYQQLRYEEAARIGQLVSAEKLSSLDYYDGLEQVANARPNETLLATNTGSSWFERTVDAASTVFADGADINLASLIDANVKASSLFSFGLDFEPTCPKDYETYVVQDFRLHERPVRDAFVITLCMLAAIRVATFFLVAWKIRTRQL